MAGSHDPSLMRPARRYAEALFALAREKGQAADVGADLAANVLEQTLGVVLGEPGEENEPRSCGRGSPRDRRIAPLRTPPELGRDEPEASSLLDEATADRRPVPPV